MDLSQANLSDAIFIGTILNDTSLNNAFIANTHFLDLDLSNTNDLDTLRHFSPSSIDHRTLMKSKNLPKKFLQNCGLPEQFIDNLPSLLNSLEPIQFHSVFISYSSKDEEFAHRLHADLQAKGIRCWFAPEDMKIGDKICPRIDEMIHVHDKLLLVLSNDSINSSW